VIEVAFPRKMGGCGTRAPTTRSGPRRPASTRPPA